MSHQGIACCLLFVFSFFWKTPWKDWEPVVLSKKKSTAKKDQPSGDAAIAVAARFLFFSHFSFFSRFFFAASHDDDCWWKATLALFRSRWWHGTCVFEAWPKVFFSCFRTGQHVDSQKKHGATQNKQNGGTLIDARKLDDPDAVVKLNKVSVDLKNQVWLSCFRFGSFLSIVVFVDPASETGQGYDAKGSLLCFPPLFCFFCWSCV